MKLSIINLAALSLSACALMPFASVQAQSTQVSMVIQGDQRCISTNGIANHSVGQFPNSGNPHTIAVQNIRYCFDANPVKGSTAKFSPGSGVALNGVTIRPGTADYYDASSPRGHSRDRSSGWNLDGMGPGNTLGLDFNNAHVDNKGLYHYHGVASALATSIGNSHIAYAADGFEIHYVGSAQKSSYQLKQGTRPTAPGGAYDGTYNEDFVYVPGSGYLDQCNGGYLNGRFVYFATDVYPFFPRCFWGNVSDDFGHGNRNSGGADAGMNKGIQPQGQKRQQQGRQTQRRNGPPQVAINACSSTSLGYSCSFSPPGRRQMSGTCRQTPHGKACVPNR